MTQPVHPLIIAEMANPEWVSVPLEGWSLSRAIQNTGGAHIVTQVRNRAAFLRAGQKEGRDFTSIDSEAVTRPIWRMGEALRMGQGKGWTTVMLANALSYPFFEKMVWKRFGHSLASGEYDLVHRVTPLSPTVSSPISVQCAKNGIPFVIGPLNGGLPWPRQFDAERRREREFLSYIRSGYRLLPGRNRTLNSADAIIAGSQYTLSEIPNRHRGKCVTIPENGVDLSRFPRREARKLGGPLRCVFVGRLVPYKCPDILIEAAAPLLSRGVIKLEFCGDGPMMDALTHQANALGLTDKITFHGHIPHASLQDVLSKSDLFTFPSIREFGGAVVIEAMALGIVPLVVDYGGPGEHVTAETGFTVAMGTRAEIMSRFREQLEAIVANPGQLQSMAEAGRKRVEQRYDWLQKARQVREVYDWVLERRTHRASYGT